MPRLGESGGSLYLKGETTHDKCPWCHHEKCEKCKGTQFQELWLGCYVCGTAAMQRKWEQEGERPRATND